MPVETVETVVETIDYSIALDKIIVLLDKLNVGIQAIYTMFYIFLVLGLSILLVAFFYKILKSFMI